MFLPCHFRSLIALSQFTDVSISAFSLIRYDMRGPITISKEARTYYLVIDLIKLRGEEEGG